MQGTMANLSIPILGGLAMYTMLGCFLAQIYIEKEKLMNEFLGGGEGHLVILGNPVYLLLP